MATAALWRALRTDDVAGARKALAKGANPNASGPHNALTKETMLDAAVAAGSFQVLDVLLAAGARLTRKKSSPMAMETSARL